MLIITLMGCAFVIYLIWLSIKSVKTSCPPKISAPVHAYDNQYDVFRDMEPQSQVRENPWIGFLQEDLAKNRTGPIGNFVGNESSSGSVPVYPII